MTAFIMSLLWTEALQSPSRKKGFRAWGIGLIKFSSRSSGTERKEWPNGSCKLKLCMWKIWNRLGRVKKWVELQLNLNFPLGENSYNFFSPRDKGIGALEWCSPNVTIWKIAQFSRVLGKRNIYFINVELAFDNKFELFRVWWKHVENFEILCTHAMVVWLWMIFG